MNRIIKADSSADDRPTKAAALDLADFATEARTVVLDARKDAARIVAEARAKADAVERQARQQGYAEGLAGGRAEGYTEGEQQARNEAGRKFTDQYAGLLGLAEQTVSGLAAIRAEGARRACEEILELAILLAEKIVSRVAVENVDAARANLAKALELADRGGAIVVKVSPEQLETLREEMSELADILGPGGAVELTGDKRISPGGVKIISRNGQIDATVETQLANTARALLGREVRARFPAASAEPAKAVPYRFVPHGEGGPSTAESQAAGEEGPVSREMELAAQAAGSEDV